jgi:hypothetical protein
VTVGGRRPKRFGRYGRIGTFGPYTDFEWGVIDGNRSALRWVLSAEWDFLDT